jgi:NAD(P)-dependent dehydrogenase (short-subunit alcohol dehydrogenase family)
MQLKGGARGANRAILITGASSGIGYATALRLAKSHWRVFATVRKDEDGERLAAEGKGRVHPIKLDVTDQQSILAASAAVEVELDGCGLGALLNNAGIGLTAPVEFTSNEALRQIFEVNLFGQIAVIRAFLPLLRTGRGRIVNVGSVADHLTPPFGGAMAASKAAFASMSSALRLELKPQGIDVVIIEPGSINTPAVDKTLGSIDGQIAALGRDAESLYGSAMRRRPNFLPNGAFRQPTRGRGGRNRARAQCPKAENALSGRQGSTKADVAFLGAARTPARRCRTEDVRTAAEDALTSYSAAPSAPDNSAVVGRPFKALRGPHRSLTLIWPPFPVFRCSGADGGGRAIVMGRWAAGSSRSGWRRSIRHPEHDRAS